MRQYAGSHVRMRREGAEAAGNNVALTPPWLVERVRGVFRQSGVIDLDPCTTPENPVGARRFITPPDDGILARWAGNVYVNPPYGRTMASWVERALTAAADGCRVIMLVPARTETRWWHEAVQGGDCLLLRGRLTFGGHENPATFPSALFGFGVTLDALCDLGTIIHPKCGA